MRRIFKWFFGQFDNEDDIAVEVETILRETKKAY